MTDDVLIDESDGVLRITWNRPETLNALRTDMLTKAADAVEASRARVIYFTGSGRSFSSGADLKDKNVSMLQPEGNRLVRAIVATERPVVAGVNGIAVGIGCAIALAADFTVAKSSGYLLQAFINIGIMPDGGATELLAASVGRARANALAMLGEKFPADQAAAEGLIYRSVADEDFETETEALVTRLAQGPTQAYARTKQALNANTLSRLDESLERELVGQRALGQTADAAEGVAAFREKRPAVFKG